MKASDLRDLPYDKLAERLDKTARLRDLRREVARTSTVMRQQEIDAYFEQQEGGSRG